MPTGALPQGFDALDDLSSQDLQALLAGARGMSSGVPQTLRSRHVAVLCEHPVCDSADALDAAASALGAVVVRLRPGTLAPDDPPQWRETARLLGRLYHVIGCEGMAPGVTAALSRWAGVPVLSDVTAASHPARILGDLLTMQEHADRPPSAIALRFVDEPDAPLAMAWDRAARLTALRLVRLEGQHAAAFPPGCDFLFDHEAPCAECGRTHLIAAGRAGRAGGRGPCLAGHQLDAHRRVLLSLLANLVG
jgi:hypothetical protein